MDPQSTFARLAALYRSIAAKGECDFEEVTQPTSPITDDEIARVEEITGCKMLPLVRAFYQSDVRRSPAGMRPFRAFYNTGEELIAQCEELAKAKQEYDWSHPPLIPLTAEEDFLVCDQDGAVSRFIGNEGQTEEEDGVENMEQFFAYLVDEAERALSGD